MDQSELLAYVVQQLDALGLDYLVGGSVASAYYGEPRFTNDLDIVLLLPLNRIRELIAAFPEPEFYMSEDAVRGALANGSQFNVLHVDGGLKIDFFLPYANEEFAKSQFARRRREEASEQLFVMFGAPEDVIIKKLEYFREGGSEKHLRDIASMLKIQKQGIDFRYIEEWVTRMSLTSEWVAVQERLSQR
jgi:hypothetical protein